MFYGWIKIRDSIEKFDKLLSAMLMNSKEVISWTDKETSSKTQLLLAVYLCIFIHCSAVHTFL